MTLKNKLYSGSLVAYGARGAPDADFIWIPTRAWFYLHVHLDEGNVVRGEGTVYFHVRVVDSRDAIDAPHRLNHLVMVKDRRYSSPRWRTLS
jgi:hypothetical protein